MRFIHFWTYILMLVFGTFYFWTQSRYPKLLEKSVAGELIETDGGIAFHPKFFLEPTDLWFEAIGKIFFNWGYDNIQGMTFGFFLGAVILSLVKVSPWFQKTYKSHWANILQGFTLGVPIGVCANCIVPVGQGLIRAGKSWSLVLTTMVSSPTFNVIVILILMLLFPWYLVLLKILGTLLIIACIPLITAGLENKKNAKSIAAESCEVKSYKNGVEAFLDAIKDFLKHLVFILQKTLGWMILAGLLGAIFIYFMPFDVLSELPVTWWSLIFIAMVGTFVPVPITFDLFLASILFQGGAPAGIVMVLLFTLGIHSIYPAMIIYREANPKVALKLFSLVVAMGVLLGMLAHQLDTRFVNQTKSVLSQQAVQNFQKEKAILKQSCRQLPDIKAQEACFKKGIKERLGKNQKADLCKLESDWLSVSQCRALIMTQRAVAEGNLDFCNGLYKELKLNCQRAVVQSVVEERRKHKAICKVLPQAEQLKCEDEVEKRRVSQIYPEFYSVLCSGFERPRNLDFCFAKRVIYQPELCDELKSSEDQLWCHEKRILTQATITIEDMYLEDPAGSRAILDIKSDVSEKPLSEIKTPQIIPEVLSDQDDIKIETIKGLPKSTWDGATVFERIELPHMGNRFGILDFFTPFSLGRGIAVGDVNKDHWPDLVFATKSGVELYVGNGTENFSKVKLDENLSSKSVFLVSLIDINNDTWVDIFLSTYSGKNFFIINDEGVFSEVIELDKNSERAISFGATFSDLDQNGFLDIGLGNVTSYNRDFIRKTSSKNEVYLNNSLDFKKYDFPEITGETLSILFSDVDQNGVTDLLVGNDYKEPDMYYFDFFEHKTPDKRSKIKHTAASTMSIDTGDINNDLHLDLFLADMSFKKNSVNYCDSIKDAEAYKKCSYYRDVLHPIIRSRSVSQCQSLEASGACMVAVALALAIQYEDKSFCEAIPTVYPKVQARCFRALEQRTDKIETMDLNDFGWQKTENVLLLGNNKQTFDPAPKNWNFQESFWAWNSKFADLDNDTWLDIYVGNGRMRQKETHSNVFYHNQKGKGFVKAQEAFGLEDYLHTPAYVYTDFDNDLDLDMVTIGINGPTRIFKNHIQSNGIIFDLKDEKGNSEAIGAKIYIYYGDGLSQIREVKSGGGFISFEDTSVHFGLHNFDWVDQVEIYWPDGEKTKITQPLKTNQKYIIHRKARQS